MAIFGVSLLGLDSGACMCFFFLGRISYTFFNRFVLLLMEEILHQLIGSLSQYLHVFTRLYIPSGSGFQLSTVVVKMEVSAQAFCSVCCTGSLVMKVI